MLFFVFQDLGQRQSVMEVEFEIGTIRYFGVFVLTLSPQGFNFRRDLRCDISPSWKYLLGP